MHLEAKPFLTWLCHIQGYVSGTVWIFVLQVHGSVFLEQTVSHNNAEHQHSAKMLSVSMMSSQKEEELQWECASGFPWRVVSLSYTPSDFMYVCMYVFIYWQFWGLDMASQVLHHLSYTPNSFAFS
jgi:hypothetical protein